MGKGYSISLSSPGERRRRAGCPWCPGQRLGDGVSHPALAQGRVDKKVLERAGDWLVNTEGAEGNLSQRLLFLLGKSPVDQNPKFRGWPWRAGNNSWVEPTAHALLALRALEGIAPEAAIRYRRDFGVRMLADRRCFDSGWNYGNKRVLGEILPSYPETTGIALVGLWSAGRVSEGSLESARAMFAAAKGAYAKAWLAVGLRLSGVDVKYEVSEVPHASGNIALNALEILASERSSW